MGLGAAWLPGFYSAALRRVSWTSTSVVHGAEAWWWRCRAVMSLRQSPNRGGGVPTTSERMLRYRASDSARQWRGLLGSPVGYASKVEERVTFPRARRFARARARSCARWGPRGGGAAARAGAEVGEPRGGGRRGGVTQRAEAVRGRRATGSQPQPPRAQPAWQQAAPPSGSRAEGGGAGRPAGGARWRSFVPARPEAVPPPARRG